MAAHFYLFFALYPAINSAQAPGFARASFVKNCLRRMPCDKLSRDIMSHSQAN
jgi:hypothetical protein